jgi:erythromycin esterase-like protein
MKAFFLIAVFLLSTCASGALPGVTEFTAPPEKIEDAALSVLLRERVAAADVVAIGETVHGSSGFLRMQTRLIRYLVTNHGLRLVVWENPTLRSLELARWVASCDKAKTPAPIAVLYMPTAADAALWDWVCDFNRAHPGDPIIFRGMDVWDRPWEHYARIRALGARAGIDPRLVKSIETCPAYHASSWPEIDTVFSNMPGGGKFQPEADYQKCRALLTALLDGAKQFGTAQQKKKEPGSDDAFELAISASTLLGWLGFYHYERSDDILSWNERDRAQGRNLMLLMAKHNATRAILSAHTTHVSHNRSAADWWGYGDLKSGVYFFSEMTRKKVFNIALTAFHASGTQGDWSLPVARNSMDKKLHDAGHAFSFFASNAAFLSEHPKWWMQNGNFPGPFESGVEFVPRDHFDAFVFFSRSALDKALPQRPMWRP